MSHGTPIGQRCRPSKIGRNKRKCERYAATNQRAKNKARKLETIQRGLQRAHEARESLARIRVTLDLMEHGTALVDL